MPDCPRNMSDTYIVDRRTMAQPTVEKPKVIGMLEWAQANVFRDDRARKYLDRLKSS